MPKINEPFESDMDRPWTKRDAPEPGRDIEREMAIREYNRSIRRAEQRAETAERERDEARKLLDKWDETIRKQHDHICELREGLSRLVDKLKLVLPKIDNYVILHTVRTGVPYDDPNLTEELAEAERLLGLNRR